MGYVSLAGMAKVAIAGTIAGGILVAGITWQGDGSVSNIKGNLDNMKDEIAQAVADNDFLKGQFSNLKGLYVSSVQEANTKIDGLLKDKADLETQKAELEARIASLESDLSESEDRTGEKEELQTEVNRLEGELDKANQQIAELETYAQSADDETSYTPVDRNAYNVDEIEVTDAEPTTEPTPAPIEEPSEDTSNEDSTPSAEESEVAMANYVSENMESDLNGLGITVESIKIKEEPTYSDTYDVHIEYTGTLDRWKKNAEGENIDQISGRIMKELQSEFGKEINIVSYEKDGVVKAQKQSYTNPIFFR